MAWLWIKFTYWDCDNNAADLWNIFRMILMRMFFFCLLKTAASISSYMVGTAMSAKSWKKSLVGVFFNLIDDSLFSRWNGAWCCWKDAIFCCCCCCCRCGCCGQPLCISTPRLPPHPPASSPPRTNGNGFFQANLSLSPRRWRQPKCESRGGRRKASSTACHCSAAAAALEPHQEDLTIPFL